MKVSFGVPPLWVEGGLRHQVLSLKRELEKKGVEVEIHSPEKKPSGIFHLFKASFSTHELAGRVKEAGIPLITTPVFYSSHPSLFPFLVKIDSSFSRFKLFSERYFIKEILTLSDLVLPNTEEEKKLCERLGARNVKLLPVGVEERFKDASPEEFVKKYGIKDFVLYAGEIGTKRKNTWRVVEALKGLPAVFIGNPRDEKILEKIKEYKFLWIPELPHSSSLLASAYAACRVFVLASLYETPGISAMEAGLAGANVVITPYGGTKEYFGKYAFYCNPYSVRSIREKVIEAMESPYRKELRERLLQFTWERIAERLVEYYSWIS